MHSTRRALQQRQLLLGLVPSGPHELYKIRFLEMNFYLQGRRKALEKHQAAWKKGLFVGLSTWTTCLYWRGHDDNARAAQRRPFRSKHCGQVNRGVIKGSCSQNQNISECQIEEARTRKHAGSAHPFGPCSCASVSTRGITSRQFVQK